jgi:protein PET117
VPVPPPSGVGAKQPAAVIDEDCETCRISPPAELLESQSREVRRAEREAREAEYRQQKDLAGRLGREQGVHVGDGGIGGGRMV